MSDLPNGDSRCLLSVPAEDGTEVYVVQDMAMARRMLRLASATGAGTFWEEARQGDHWVRVGPEEQITAKETRCKRSTSSR